MKKLFTLIVVTSIALLACTKVHKTNPETSSMDDFRKRESAFYSFKMKKLNGEVLDFQTLKGKKILIVNTASKCGYTPQYEALQELHEKYGESLVVLGFPCNQFGGQEPGSSEDIASFCKLNYGVTFTMMEKINVKKGDDQSPLYRWLSDPKENGWNDEAPSWNFCKYYIDDKGELKDFFNSNIKPMDEEVIKAISK
ncbi:glutathione peroxidase [Flammeovirga yaeyamensis]|uniref:Glutathione peroxidase n=1 Tax=Flammeovirga yaeyamensis TaxID=367791 RepID=A0AAX1N9G0_9BACT|nr:MULTISPECIES: glutathione peroxidase [Flammeovirga]ANQ49440.1 glutathione peroxidase [Flammeovirga sp. MY04]MBB3697673.1 glutathione peroxidase [Flammeovirga yaeyamensis]NMF35967.1 glutathione peroxidase [Flammeovirga yaeyamensis]QWG03086.1 glutathione peroxidase [Flammeovirga yaeyamensis]